VKHSNSQSTVPAASQRNDQAAMPPSKAKGAGTGPVAGRSKKAEGVSSLNSRTAAKAVRSALSKQVKTLSRSVARAAKKTLKGKPASKSAPKSNASSKQDSVLALLRRPQGVTIDALAKATGWQRHSIRGFLAGTVRKKLKLPLLSEKINGVRTYRLKAGKAGKAAAKTGKSRPV
jgi:hypothetical protein